MEKIFMDTAFLIAVIDNSDSNHSTAVECYKRIIKEKQIIVTTEAVLTELGNGLSKIKWRKAAHKWITQLQKSREIFRVIHITAEILNKAVDLYGSRSDKEWSLTDCISFIIMQKYHLTKALTLDRHFEQAGFKILMAI